MNEQRFNFLLEKFVSGTITPDEEDELKNLVRSGRYQEHFREDLTRFMEDKLRSSTSPNVPFDADQLFNKILRSDVEESIAVQSERFTLRYWARIAAMLVLGFGLGWWLFESRNTHTDPLTGQMEESASNELIRYTKKDFIHLPDGSKVLLNEESELSFLSTFGDSIREVHLKGEAFFDIVSDPQRPFVVRTGTISTNVLGTAFNVNARDHNIVVTVERGLVQVNDEIQTLSLVRPHERLVVDTESKSFEKSDIIIAEEIKWKSNNLIFDDIPLLQTAELLQDHFGVEIKIENPAIEECRISAWFLENESLEEILEMVCGIRQAQYVKSNDRIIISGGISCDM